MTALKLSELTEATSLAATDLIDSSVDNGDSTYTSKKVTFANINASLSDATISSKGTIALNTQTISGGKTVTATSASQIPITLKGATSQTGKLLEIVDSASASLISVSSSGQINNGTATPLVVGRSITGTGVTQSNLVAIGNSLTVNTSGGSINVGRSSTIGGTGLNQSYGFNNNIAADNANNIGALGVGTNVTIGSSASNSTAVGHAITLSTANSLAIGYGLTVGASGGSAIGVIGVNATNNTTDSLMLRMGSSGSYLLVSTAANTVGINTATHNGSLHAQNVSGQTSTATLVARAITSQTGDLLQIRNSAGTVLTAFAVDGKLSVFAGVSEGTNVAVGTTTGTKIGTATSQKLGFWNATPIIQPSTAAYTTNSQSSAYTGIDNAQAGSVYGKLTDINALRTAYENLRASYDDLLTKLKTTGIIA